MVTIEVEVSDPVKLMLEELREEHGDAVVDEDLTQAVEQSVWAGYQNKQS